MPTEIPDEVHYSCLVKLLLRAEQARVSSAKAKSPLAPTPTVYHPSNKLEQREETVKLGGFNSRKKKLSANHGKDQPPQISSAPLLNPSSSHLYKAKHASINKPQSHSGLNQEDTHHKRARMSGAYGQKEPPASSCPATHWTAFSPQSQNKSLTWTWKELFKDEPQTLWSIPANSEWYMCHTQQQMPTGVNRFGDQSQHMVLK